MHLSSKICPTCGNAKPPDPLVDKLPKAFRDGFIAAGDGKSTTDYSKGIFEGRMVELTIGMEEHPEWFHHGCMCDLCLSYE